MSTENVNPDPSGTEPTSSGSSQQSSSPEANTVNTEVVNTDPEMRESYTGSFVKKLMTEKKNQGERLKEQNEELEAFRSKDKERTENQLKENNKWEEFAKLKEQEAKDSKDKLDTLNTRLDDAGKFNALLDVLPGTVEKQYWPLLESHLDGIVKNPETGEIDELSVKQVADKVRAQYADIIKVASNGSIPQNAAQPNAVFDTSQWGAMSPADKKKNLKAFVEQKNRS